MRWRIEQLMALHAHDPDDGFAETVCIRDSGDPEGETVLFDPVHHVDSLDSGELDASLEQYVMADAPTPVAHPAPRTPLSSRWDVALVVAGLYCAALLAGSATVLTVAWFLVS